MKDIAQYIDSTNLSHQATRDEINKLIDDAIQYNFAGICISPVWTIYAKNRLERLGANTKLITVPNWQLGGGLLQNIGIADDVCRYCDEIDYVWNCYEYSDLKAWDRIEEELKIMREKTKGKLKIIIEAYYLRKMDNNVYKLGLKRVFKEACKLVNKSGADWIKTDSGLFKRPDFDSLVEDCKLILKYSKLPCKAAGGIKTREQAEKLIKLGVKRIGTSNAVKIVTGEV
jgi:deoxyribose-phosphate aldolase